MKPLLLICLLMSSQFIFAQANQKDEQGRRHGKWQTFFPETQELKFEGEFSHGKEIGIFKFYKEELKNPTALMYFEPNKETVKVQYLAQNGKIISEGNMLNQQRTGLWTYFHKNSSIVMMLENYRDGKLEGEKKIFYEDKSLAEEATYVNDKITGKRKLYSPKGAVLEELTYVNGELHGPAKFYNDQGELMSEGNYKNDKHHGNWRYYENGELTRQKEY